MPWQNKQAGFHSGRGFTTPAAAAQYAGDVEDLEEAFPGRLLDTAQERATGRFGFKDWWLRSSNPLMQGPGVHDDWRTYQPMTIPRGLGFGAGGGVIDRAQNTVARRKGERMAANRAHALGISDQPDRQNPEQQGSVTQPSGPLGGGGAGELGGAPHLALGPGRRGGQFQRYFGGVGSVRDDEPVEAELIPMKAKK